MSWLVRPAEITVGVMALNKANKLKFKTNQKAITHVRKIS